MSFYSYFPLEELTDLVARNPDDVQLRLALVEHYVCAENYDNALVQAVMAEDLGTRDPEVDVWKSMCLIYNGQLEEGHDGLQRVVRNNPCCEFQMRLITEIIPLFTGEINDPSQIDWLSELANYDSADLDPIFIARINSFIAAGGLLQESSDEGIGALEEHVGEYPNDISARLYLAIAYCGCLRMEDAARTYQEVLDQDDECATAWFDLAAVVNDPVRSIELTRKGLESCPFARHARYNLGMFLMQSGDAVQARCELSRIPADSPIYVEAQVAIGMSYEDEGDIPNAVESLERAVTLRPDRPDVRGKYGQLLCDCGLHDEAIRELDLAIELDGNQYCVWANKGLLHLQKGEHQYAMEALQRSLDLNPQSEDAAINLAVLLAETGSVDQGIEILQEAIEHHPDHPLICQNLGAFYCNKRQLDEALFYTERSVELGIDSPAIFWNLANIYCFKDKRNECLENLAKAIEGDETFAAQFRMDEDFKKYWKDPGFVSLIGE